MQTSKTKSSELIARRPAAEKAITSAEAAIKAAIAARDGALEADDRKAYDAALYDLGRSELALTKSKKALETLTAEIASVQRSETASARDAAQARRDADLEAAAGAARAEASAFLEALKRRLARQALVREARQHQAECERLSSVLGETYFAKKNIDATPGAYEAARELYLLTQGGDIDPQLQSLAMRLILDIAPNFHAPSVAV